MTTIGKHSTSGLNLSDPRTLTRPRPPWRRRDPRHERCGVCGIGAVYVVTASLHMESPTLSLPGTLVTLSCEPHVKRVKAALVSINVHVRDELLYETWGLRWTMFAESMAVPFAWTARTVAGWWRTLFPARRARRAQDRRIAADTARALAALESATSTEDEPSPRDEALTKPTSLRGSIG
jgi:hypothetical protein